MLSFEPLYEDLQARAARKQQPIRRRRTQIKIFESAPEHLFDSLDNFVMFQQIAPPTGPAAHFDRFQKFDIVLQHSSHSLLDEFFRPASRLRREVFQLGFLMLCEMYFHLAIRVPY